MFAFFRRNKGRNKAGKELAYRVLRARYDAAQNTADLRRHWGNADYLSAASANSASVRRELRARARYEIANNSYAAGIVRTLVEYVVGTGPRLQMLTEDRDVNKRVEQLFSAWAAAVNLSDKLYTLRHSQVASGEGFAVYINNPRIDSPVKLDINIVEADRIALPASRLQLSQQAGDGIEYDSHGNPVRYFVLNHHPGDAYALGYDEYQVIPAAAMIHTFRRERPGQLRGIPEITPALPLFALLRQYTLAVLTAAQNAAMIGGIIKSDVPVDADDDTIEPFDEIEFERNLWMTLPPGHDISQLRAEQPTTVYSDFKRELLNEIARCLNMPFNIAAGNSSGYNYASGRLDHQAFFKSIGIEQSVISLNVLDRIFRAWLNEAILIEGYLPQPVRMLNADVSHTWFWDGVEHVDPAKEANAQKTRLESNTTTLAAEYARQGRDWETELRQRAREKELIRELGLVDTEAAPTGSQESPATSGEEEEVEDADA